MRLAVYHYPEDFPPESRAAVAAEKLRAGRDFDKARDNAPRTAYDRAQYHEVELRKYILRRFGVFVREACKLGQRGIWHVDQIEKEAREFLRSSTIEVIYDKASRNSGRQVGGDWLSNWDGSIQPEAMRQFERHVEWREFQDALLQVAESQAAQAEHLGERARERIGTGTGDSAQFERVRGALSSAGYDDAPETTVTTSDEKSSEAELVGENGERVRPTSRFPNRAGWLKERMLERGWSNNEASKYGGPDRKTIERIIRCEPVRNEVLQNLAEALSKKHMKVSVLHIPQD